MRKEVLIAIIIGFSLGLVITFGMWTANKALKQTAPKQQIEVPETEPQTLTPTSVPLALQITSPEENSVSTQQKILVSGKASALGTVVILYQEGEKILEADSVGNFSTEITLVGGDNEITISTYDDAENEVSKTINVIYSTAEL